jgi:tetratricopeptide (TPR) repeat protein/serine/threonine protein kinase
LSKQRPYRGWETHLVNEPLTVLGDAVDAFEESWQRGEAPTIDDFLPADPTARLVVLARLIHIDLEYRLRRGESVRVESYVDRYADLAVESAILIDLAAWEFHLRRPNEPGLSDAEYRHRFPQLEPGLSERFHPRTMIAATAAKPLPATAGRYRLEEEIARGAMGRIVRVRDEDFDRPLAMKILLGRSADLDDRFVRESRMTGLLQHPGVPPVHALGRLEDGRPYFVMKLVQGRSLLDLLRAKDESAAAGVAADAAANPTKIGSESFLHQASDPPLSVGRDRANGSDGHPKRSEPQARRVDFPALVTIFKNICDTVGYAHSRGVVHRDLKPANIMVGAFGEVQVMDWGLAKMIGEKDAPAAKDDLRAVFSLTRAETVTGSILGTPSYMAPEQARGEANLDARADVFGLGAILCEMLTGRAPYEGRTLHAVLRKAVAADLTEAFERLAGCGADAGLVELTRRCLSANKDDRPANGAVVAAAIEAYRADLAERLKQAEIDRAAEHARADEEHKRRQAEHAEAKAERKRRQMTVVVAAGLLLALAAGSAAALWIQADHVRQQAELEARRENLNREVKNALDQAAEEQAALHKRLGDPALAHQLVSDIDHWKSALDRTRAAWERAGVGSAGDRELLSEELAAKYGKTGQILKADERDWTLAAKLDDARLQSMAILANMGDIEHLMEQFSDVFRVDFGADILNEKAGAVAAKIEASNLRYVLLASIDHWSMLNSIAGQKFPGLLEQHQEARQRSLAIARESEFEGWRDEFFRDEFVLDDPKELAEFAKRADLEAMPPAAIIAVAVQLPGNEKSAFLRRAAANHPRDFWLHLFLSALPGEAAHRLGSAKTALAIRPRSGGAAAFLGLTYSLNGDHDAAVLFLQKAVEWDPKLAMAHAFLGLTLRDRNDLAGAIKAWRKTFELDSENFVVNQFLGQALLDDGKVDEAIVELRRALTANVDTAMLHDALGVSLHKKGDLEGAIEHLQQAVDAPYYFAPARVHLGEALLAKKDMQKAIELFREVTESAPNYAPAFEALGGALLERGEERDFAVALAHLQKAIDLAPTSAGPYQKFGIALGKKKNWSGAAEKLQKAVDLDPQSVTARCLLGEALLKDKQPFRAIGHYRKAVALAPEHGEAHAGLGVALFENGDLDAALPHLRKAVAIDPASAASRQLDQALLKKKDVDTEAERWKQEADKNPNDAGVQFKYGAALRNKQDLPGAIAQFRKALEANPGDVQTCDALANALYDDGQFDEAIAQFRQGINLDAAAIDRRERIASLLRNVNDLPGAIEQYKKIAELDAGNAKRLQWAGQELQRANEPAAAIECYRKAIALGIGSAPIHLDLGVALYSVGQFAEGHDSLQLAVKRLPVNGEHHVMALEQLKKYNRLTALDRELETFLRTGAMPKAAPDQLELADFCRNVKRYHGAAARLYGAAFPKRYTQSREDLDRLKDSALRSALLAAAGEGLEPRQPDPSERSKFRQQALDLLQAELARYEKAKSSSRLDVRLDVWSRLSQWRNEPDLAGVREPAALALLPDAEQASWRKLWSDVERVMKLAPTMVSEMIVRGTLTDRTRERTLDLKLPAGLICLIEQLSLSPDFNPEVRLLDSHENVVAESSKASPEANAVRLIHTSSGDPTYRIVASSFQARSTGPYVLAIRVFGGKSK